MKAFKTILVIITGILLQSCTKTYEIQFDKLFLVAIENFKTPIFIENCKMVIKTEDDFNINKYTKNSKDPELLNFISYAADFEDDYNNENASVFYIPDDINKGNIILYDNTTNTKYIEISLNKGIKSISVYENGKVVSEAKGDIQIDDIEGFWYYLASGNMKFYDYDSNGKQYVSKEKNFVYQPELEEITQNDYYEDNETTEDYEIEETYTSNNNKQSNNKPSWLIGSWRTPLGDTGALIVNVNRDDANVWIMNGVSLVNRIDYEDWTVFDDMLYLINDGERLIDSPSFFIDYNNRTIIGHIGERFEKHY